jgi:hypothetical protein
VKLTVATSPLSTKKHYLATYFSSPSAILATRIYFAGSFSVTRLCGGAARAH